MSTVRTVRSGNFWGWSAAEHRPARGRPIASGGVDVGALGVVDGPDAGRRWPP